MIRESCDNTLRMDTANTAMTKARGEGNEERYGRSTYLSNSPCGHTRFASMQRSNTSIVDPTGCVRIWESKLQSTVKASNHFTKGRLYDGTRTNSSIYSAFLKLTSIGTN